ncbi:MAG: hypothetical protein M3457_03335 [Chloroflexota bacterium]|nr:hypothetical protein [Chloroflexota bacterium]
MPANDPSARLLCRHAPARDRHPFADALMAKVTEEHRMIALGPLLDRQGGLVRLHTETA